MQRIFLHKQQGLLSHKLLGVLLLSAIVIMLLPFIFLHENIANHSIHHYKSAPTPPSPIQIEQKGVVGFLTRLKTHSQLLLHQAPQAWMIQSTNVFTAADGAIVVANLQAQKLSAYTEIVNPKTQTVRIKLGPVIQHQEAVAMLKTLNKEFPQLKGIIVRYNPLKD